MPGPARTPTAELAARGSKLARGRLRNDSVPAGTPEPPSHLSERALEEWAKLVPILLARKTLTTGDGAILGEHCEAVADVEKYKAALAKTGDMVETPNGFLQRHPYTVLLREAKALVIDTGRLLALNPVDRSKVTPTQGEANRNRFTSIAGGKS